MASSSSSNKQKKFEKELIRIQLKYSSWNGSMVSSILLLYEIFNNSKQTQKIIEYKENIRKFLRTTYASRKEINEINYFNSLFLFNLVQFTENTLMDLVKLVLITYPKKMSDASIKLSDLIDNSKQNIIETEIDKYLQKLMYKKPEEYFKEIFEILSIEPVNLSLVENFIEMKARRDLGIHNNWITNQIYIEKTKRLGIKTKNVSTIPNEKYLMTVYDMSNKLIEEVFSRLKDKYGINN